MGINNFNDFDVYTPKDFSAREWKRAKEREERKMKKSHTKYNPITPLKGSGSHPNGYNLSQTPVATALAKSPAQKPSIPTLPNQSAAEAKPFGLDIVHELTIGRKSGKGGGCATGVYAYNTPDEKKKRVRVVIGGDVIDLMEWPQDVRLTLAMLRDGRFAVIESPKGWKLDKQQSNKCASVRIPNVKTSSDRVVAELVGDHFIFPAGSFITL